MRIRNFLHACSGCLGSNEINGVSVTPFILEAGITPRMDVSCIITRASGSRDMIRLRSRLDTQAEVEYLHHGGIFHYVVRRLIKQGA
jgi:aconitase A